MTQNNEVQLVISAIGTDRPGIVNEISQIIIQNKGNIDDSRMTVLGGEFAIILLISAADEALDIIEKTLTQQASSLNLNIMTKQTGHETPTDKLLPQNTLTVKRSPYLVEILAIDNPGIVYQLADFFSQQSINIQSMQTSRYQAPHTGTQMFAIDMVIAIPQTIILSELRDDFLDLCEDMNLDASIEAYRA